MLNNMEKKKDFSMLGPMHQILAGTKALFCRDNFELLKITAELCGESGYHSHIGF